MCVKVSSIIPIFMQLLHDNSIRNGNHTWGHVEQIHLFLLLVHLFIRFQHYALKLGILMMTVPAGPHSGHHLLVTGFVQKHTTARCTTISHQGINVNVSLADEASLVEAFFGALTTKASTSSRFHLSSI